MVAKNIRTSIENTVNSGEMFDMSILSNTYSENKKLYYAANKEISRLEQAGKIKKLRKGLYYKPRISTITGQELVPTRKEITAYYEKYTDITFYLTGIALYNELRLTDQQPSTFEYAAYFPPKSFEKQRVVFVKAKCPVNDNNSHYLQILDCIENIDKIPNQSVDMAKNKIAEYIKNNYNNSSDLEQIKNLSLFYNRKTAYLAREIINQIKPIKYE